MLQKYYTTKLFYNKYLYKLRVKSTIASLFRGLNLGYVKSKLDAMQREAESEMPISCPFNQLARRKNNSIDLETFMDACVVYNALEKNKSNAMVRCEGYNLDMYSNEPDWLHKLQTQVSAVQWHEPENDEIFNYLIDNANTKIIDGDVEWEFKAILGKKVDESVPLMSIDITTTVKTIGPKKLSRYHFFFFPVKRLMASKNRLSLNHLMNWSAIFRIPFSIGDLENPLKKINKPKIMSNVGNRKSNSTF